MVRHFTAFLLALSVATPAFAADPSTSAGPAPAASPAATTPAASPAATPEERESPDWFTESTVFSSGRSLPGHPPLGNFGLGNVPIVGVNANGDAIDVRDGRVLTPDEVTSAEAANSLGGMGPGVTLLHAEVSKTKGLTKGKFKDGSAELAKGKLGKVTLDAGSAYGYASTGLAIGGDGVRTGGVVGTTLTAIGVSTTTKTAGFGKKDSTIKGAAEGYGYAMAGADGSLAALARVGTDAIALGARAGAFIGASTGLSGVGELNIAGIAVRILAGASAGYGLGGDVAAFFKIDWANFAVRLGGAALAGFGPSAGASVDVEISAAALMKKLGVNKAIANGVKRVASFFKNAAARVASGLGFGSPAPATGTDAARDAATVQTTTASSSVQTSGAASAGIQR